MKTLRTWWQELNALVQLLVLALVILAGLAILPSALTGHFEVLFSNREKALVMWILVFLTWGLSRREIAKSILDVLKALFQRKILIVLAAMVVYIGSEVWLFHRIGLWKANLMKDTVFWTFGTAFVYVVNANQATEKEHFFRKIVLDSLKLVLVLEFLVNFYTFNLWIEIILVPLIFTLVGMRTIADTNEEYQPVKKATDTILAVFGIAFLVFAMIRFLGDPDAIATSDSLRMLILPPALTLAYLPFLYFLALLMAYESLFVRIDIFLKGDKSMARFTKQRILVLCHVDLGKLNRFARDNTPKLRKLKDKNDVMSMIRNFKNR